MEITREKERNAMTMSQQDKERFLQALESDPLFLAEVRNRLLSPELLQLPERVAQLAKEVAYLSATVANLSATVSAFIEEQKTFNADVSSFIEEQKTFNADVSSFIEEQKAFNADVSSFIEEQKKFNKEQKKVNKQTETRLKRITDDLGDMKGHVAGRVARDRAEYIAEEFGFQIVEELTRKELTKLLRDRNPGDIDSPTRQSFYRADLVARVRNQEGKESYMTLEASYTADERDTGRAARNAELMNRFTGLPAFAAIASLRNVDEIKSLVESGEILWYQFDPKDLDPE